MGSENGRKGMQKLHTTKNIDMMAQVSFVLFGSALMCLYAIG
jgi:hypothetical protein